MVTKIETIIVGGGIWRFIHQLFLIQTRSGACCTRKGYQGGETSGETTGGIFHTSNTKLVFSIYLVQSTKAMIPKVLWRGRKLLLVLSNMSRNSIFQSNTMYAQPQSNKLRDLTDFG